jgi:hypothetical protein
VSVLSPERRRMGCRKERQEREGGKAGGKEEEGIQTLLLVSSFLTIWR